MSIDKIEQNNEQGTNIVIINVLKEVLRRYENVLCINEEISFLDDATENLIRDGRLFLEDVNIDRVRHCLDEKKACLIMAPEGRGKTYLSRIIGYKYHHEQRMEVFFLDFKDSNRVRDNSSISIGDFQDQLQEWHKIKEKNYLLVLENVHAYHYLSALKELIFTRLRIPDNHTWFLLNARPTDIELEDFSDWEEQTVDLKPDIKNINGIIDLYAKELGREPFGNNEQDRTAFIERIYPHENNPVGANLRLLSIYLKTWQKHPEKLYITNIDEQTILKDFRKTYLENKSSKEIKVLWYISCLYQFDVPLHEDLNQEVGSFENDFLRYDGSQYHLPHSVDAFFLFKAICNYKKSDYREKTREFVNCYVNTILANSNPRKFEGDFRLLIQGLIQRKTEFQVLINELADWPMVERIIKNTNPGFIIIAFNPQNGHSPQEILDYYKANLDWLKTFIFEINPSVLNLLCYNFKKYLKHNIFKDFFKNPEELNDYLRNNENVFYQSHILEAICDLGEKYKQNLKDYYKQNIDRLWPSFLRLSPIQLVFDYRFFKTHFEHNIIKDFIKDPQDLNDYLRNNEKAFYQGQILEAICDLGKEYKCVLINYYKQNTDRLKPNFFGLSPIKLCFIYRFFKSDLNIFKDIFNDPKDLCDYLRDNYKLFRQDEVLEAISGMGKEYKRVLIDYYKQNIDRLKPYFLGLGSTRLNFIYRFFKSDLNIFKDIFNDPNDLCDYLRNNYKLFRQNEVLEAISGMGEEYKRVLIDYYKQDTDKLKLSFLELNPVTLSKIYLFFNGRLNHNIIEDIFKKDPTKALDDYLKINCNRLNDTIIRAIGDLGDEYKLVLEKYKVNRHGYDFFFSTPKNGYCVSGNKIDFFKDSNTPFDVTCIENNSFYLYRIDWYDMQRFVKIIQKNMNDDNRQRSIEMVEALIQIVLDKIYSIFLAKARDLFYFYLDIASVDKNLFENLINEKFVIIDIKYRLSRKKYSLDDLRLFSLFYNEEWFYRDMVKIVNKSLDSLNEADEKDLSMLLGNLKYNNDNFYKDLITNEIIVGIAKKRLDTFSFREDYLYLFGHFYSQNWCKDEMNSLINKADKKQQKVIKEWHEKVKKGLKEGEKTLDIGTLWDYINNKFFNGQQKN